MVLYGECENVYKANLSWAISSLNCLFNVLRLSTSSHSLSPLWPISNFTTSQCSIRTARHIYRGGGKKPPTVLRSPSFVSNYHIFPTLINVSYRIAERGRAQWGETSYTRFEFPEFTSPEINSISKRIWDAFLPTATSDLKKKKVFGSVFNYKFIKRQFRVSSFKRLRKKSWCGRLRREWLVGGDPWICKSAFFNDLSGEFVSEKRSSEGERERNRWQNCTFFFSCLFKLTFIPASLRTPPALTLWIMHRKSAEATLKWDRRFRNLCMTRSRLSCVHGCKRTIESRSEYRHWEGHGRHHDEVIRFEWVRPSVERWNREEKSEINFLEVDLLRLWFHPEFREFQLAFSNKSFL